MKNKNVLLGLISFSLIMILSAGSAFAEVEMSGIYDSISGKATALVFGPFGLDSLEGIIIMITFALMIGGFLEVLNIFKNNKVIWGIGFGGSLMLMYNLVAFNLLGALMSVGLIGMLMLLFMGIGVSAYGWFKNKQKASDTAGFDQKVNRQQQKINKKEMTEIKSELDTLANDEKNLTEIYNLTAMFLAQSQGQQAGTAFDTPPASDRIAEIRAKRDGLKQISKTDRDHLHKLFKDAVSNKNVAEMGSFATEVKRTQERIRTMRTSLLTVETKITEADTTEKATEYLNNL